MRARYLVPVALLSMCVVAPASGGQPPGDAGIGYSGGVFTSGRTDATRSLEEALAPGPSNRDDTLAGGAGNLNIFVHEGEGSGTLDGVPFGDTSSATFVFTAEVNPADRRRTGSGWSIDHTTASITIDGVGTFQFVTGTRSYVSNSHESVGFSRALDPGPGWDLFQGPSDPAFQSWEMDTSIGPITGTGELLQWGPYWNSVHTTGGVLVFDDGMCSATFTAEITLIFTDGFESGDTSAWSSTVP